MCRVHETIAGGETIMNVDDIKTVAVIGAGDMGHGIAEVGLLAGCRVFLHFLKPRQKCQKRSRGNCVA